MVLTPANAPLGVAVVSGVVLCWLGLYCYRRWNEPGVLPFAVAMTLFGVCGIVGGVVATLQVEIPPDDLPLYVEIGFIGWIVAAVPWAIFALQYTGRFTRIRPRTVVALAAPATGIPALFLMEAIGYTDARIVMQLLGTVTLLYVIGLATLSSYLLLRTSYEYGHLSTVQGVLLTVAEIAPLLLINLISAQVIDAPVSFVVYAAAFATPAVVLPAAVFRNDLFESTPAAGALGERAIPRETDDLVFVIDREGRVVKVNRTAVEKLGLSRAESLGRPFDELVGSTVERLRSAETVELGTVDGTRKFDPQVTAFTDQHDRRLGTLLSLRDVTERELRKQRLEVLNRVLRHNLRNRVDVIKSNAEALADGGDEEFADSILDSADKLAALSATASSIDRLVSRPARTSEGDLSTVVRELTDVDTDLEVTVDCPPAAPLVTDWGALRAAIGSAVENATEYATGSVSVSVAAVPGGYEVVVSDDGPGIPDSELASIDAESETPLQHGTGLGLWQLEWAVTKLNGKLSVDTTDGTTVRMTIPHRDERVPSAGRTPRA